MKILSLLVLAFLLGSSSYASMGNEGGHGGDPYSMEFTMIGEALSAKLAKEQANNPGIFLKWKFTADSFKQAVETVRVTSAEGSEVILRGQVVDAINDSTQNLIQVNRTRWREDDIQARTKLVLHEYFGILGVERDRYEASIEFSDFAIRASREIVTASVAGTYMVNLFYGHALSIPSIDSPTICDSASPKLANALAAATTEAEGQCRISGKNNCELVNTSYTESFSTTAIGMRYCEVLVIMK